ncbi:MAG: VWA domain-containing protein [Rhizobiaceae bacterium]|nr:VWA domain-containing protein [Rhizobiaceae bacterium]
MADPEAVVTRQSDAGSQAGRKATADAFPGGWGDKWRNACERLEQAGYGASICRAYHRHGPEVARHAGPANAVRLGRAVSEVVIRAGRQAAAILPEAAVIAAIRLKDGEAFHRWLELVELTARHAPESVSDLLLGTSKFLSLLDVSGLEAFIRMGIATGRSDPERRRRFLACEDEEAGRFLDRESGQANFVELESRLKLYFPALWGMRPAIVEVPRNAPEHLRRRTGFGQGIIHMPAAFPGFNADRSKALYHAALAHMGAHMRFSRKTFPVGELKPLQMAMIALIEDARAERLAMKELPGLAALWRPFHDAPVGGSPIAAGLMARLAGVLVDPDREDADGWVSKGRSLFEEAFAKTPHAQGWVREIGGLLGNDLGQMRLQFDAKTYVVQPAYRDDSMWLWSFDEEDRETMNAEQMLESARLETEETEDAQREPQDSEPDDSENAEEVTLSLQEERGILAARYPEFDHLSGRERPDWCSVFEYVPAEASPKRLERLLEERSDLAGRLTALIRASRISRQERMRRQTDGEFLDLDACIEAAVARRAGEVPDTRIHGRYERRNRDLSVHLLIDTSRSTGDPLPGSGKTVLNVEQEAAALMAHAMAELGDPFAVAGFCSDTREDVRYLRIKEFGEAFDSAALSRLCGLESAFSTRLGAAMRHAAADLQRQQTHRRLLLVVTDGEPSDIDVDGETYLCEDARAAVHAINRQGIDVFCVMLDSGARSDAERIFGTRNILALDAAEKLVDVLPALYLRLRE